MIDLIHTANLVLEPMGIHHAELLFDALQSEELYTFIPLNPPSDVDALRQKYARWSKGKSDDGKEIWINLAIFHPRLDAYVGTLQSTIMIDQKKAYIAYEVFPAFQKQGIAKEACSAMIEYVTRQYTLREILAHADTRNQASVALLESLGFALRETLYHADEFKGCVSDEYVYSLDTGL